MSDLSLDDFSQLTTRFYDAATDDKLWPDAIGTLKSHLNLSQAVLGWFSDRSTNTLYGDCTPYFTNLFFNLGDDNIFVAPMLKSSPGTVFQDQSLLPKDEFKQSVIYNEWFVPQDEHSTIVGKLASGPRGHGVLTVQRGGRQPAFSEADLDFTSRLMPTLIHALAIRQRLGLARLQRRGAAYDVVSIGFAVTDANGLLLQRNETAERQFAENQGLFERQGRLCSNQPSELAALIAKAAAPIGVSAVGGDTLITAGEDRHPAYIVSVGPATDGPSLGLPIERGAMIFIQALNPKLTTGFETRMQSLFGLTPKEASLAMALASGHSLKDAADERFISIATARTQLGQIFRKTNTSQQSQMVSLLLRVLPVIH